MSCEIKEGMIRINSEAAKEFGFTTELFSGDSYLWKAGDTIIVSNIEAKIKGKGALRSLFEKIEEKNFTIAVPTPMRRMQEILVKNGFRPTVDEEDGCTLWIKHPKGYEHGQPGMESSPGTEPAARSS